MPKYRKRPVVIEAAQFTGDNYAEVRAALDIPEGEFYELDPEDLAHSDDPDAPASLFVAANGVWLQLVPGEWVIRDRLGLYPCKSDVFAETYELTHD